MIKNGGVQHNENTEAGPLHLQMDKKSCESTCSLFFYVDQENILLLGLTVFFFAPVRPPAYSLLGYSNKNTP